MFAPLKKKIPPPPRLAVNFLLTRSSRELPRESHHPLLTFSHCLTALISHHSFLGLSHLTEELVNPLALSTDLSSVTPAVSGAQFSGFTDPGFPSYSKNSHRAWSHLPCFIAKQQVLTLAWIFFHYAFAKTYTATAGHSAATRQKAGNTREDVHHHRTEPSDPSAEKEPRKFQNVNWSCLPHIAFTKPGLFQAAKDTFQRHTLCFTDKAILLTAGRIITGTQKIITPMIGHEVGVGGRSNFLS